MSGSSCFFRRQQRCKKLSPLFSGTSYTSLFFYKIFIKMRVKRAAFVGNCQFFTMKSVCTSIYSKLYLIIEKGGFQVEKVRYMISDAANTVQVESHVLRYWEEELELTVPRNELGHRYYTQENIQEFLRIKELKERGYQLKAIKLILQDEKDRKVESVAEPAIRIEKVDGVEIGKEVLKELMAAKNEVIHVTQKTSQMDESAQREKRMEQFQSMMTEIVRKAIMENNQDLGEEVGVHVGERVLKEMNYLMRTQEEQEEERFRKLDDAIRSLGRHGRRRAKKERLSRKERRMLKNKNELAPDLTI